jgi:hypothetical protein
VLLLLRRQPRALLHLLLLLLLPVLVLVMLVVVCMVVVVVMVLAGCRRVVSSRLVGTCEGLSSHKGVLDGLPGCPPGLRVGVQDAYQQVEQSFALSPLAGLLLL